MTQRKRSSIDAEERCENACRPHRLLGYNRDELGMYLVDRGAEEIAETQFRRAIWLNPYESEFKIHLAGCLFRQGRYDEAKEWALKALASVPHKQSVLNLVKLIDARAAQSASEADAQSAH